MGGSAGQVRETHEVMAFITVVLLIITAAIRIFIVVKKKDDDKSLKNIAFIMYALATISVFITGYFGGTLVYEYMKSFTWARDTEMKHASFYKNALAALQAGDESMLPSGYEVCPVCGNTYEEGNVDEKCAFCQTSRDSFEKI